MSKVTTADDGWVSVELGGGWCADCRLVPRHGRPAIVELHVRPADTDVPPDSEITTTLLRQLTMAKIAAQVARQRTMPSLEELFSRVPDPDRPYPKHGKRRRDERILAMVAVLYEECVTAGSRHPARDVWETLNEFHDRAGSPPSVDDLRLWGPLTEFPDIDPNAYPAYTRSSVRTLILEARKRGYLFDDAGTPRLVKTAPLVIVVDEGGHEEILAGDSAAATFHRAERRDGRRRPTST